MIIKHGVILGTGKQVFDFLKELTQYAKTDVLCAEYPFTLDRFENQVNDEWWEQRLLLRQN